MSRPMSGRWRR
uniref:Uncharacterized protein n=1 Tax=Rhizophora mucronata TaxID=61149 RepID=A0A2P2PWW3_RHIMU